MGIKVEQLKALVKDASSKIVRDVDLDELPKELLSQLSAKLLAPYAKKLRGQRNTYKSLFEAQRRRADRLEEELEAARDACKRMKLELSANACNLEYTNATVDRQ